MIFAVGAGIALAAVFYLRLKNWRARIVKDCESYPYEHSWWQNVVRYCIIGCRVDDVTLAARRIHGQLVRFFVLQ